MSEIDLARESDFSDRDDPSPDFIARMRGSYPSERETDELMTRKMLRRSGPPYRRVSREQLRSYLHAMLSEKLAGEFAISNEHWFTGGVSKIQLGFTLDWTDPDKGPRSEKLVVRMDPSESTNATSRLREFELLQAFDGSVPVPEVFFLDEEGKWFPEPALIYSFVPGVTKPSEAATGQISGLGTVFGESLREKLAPQFLDHLVRIHTFDHEAMDFRSMDRPKAGTTEAAEWQLNRARRIWEEDRGEDVALLEVAANWLERNLPVTDRISVVHGDYRSGNFLFDEDTGKILTWLDWERGHLGDRHRDLAWMIQTIMGHYSEDGSTYYVCGLIPLDEFFERYEEASGLRVDQDTLHWFRVLNAFQICVSMLASAYRITRLGKSHQDVLLVRVRAQAPAGLNELWTLMRERL